MTKSSNEFTLREKHIIDFFKGATGPFVLALIIATGDLLYSWVSRKSQVNSKVFDCGYIWPCTALTGTDFFPPFTFQRSILWVLKSRIFGDKNWEKPVTPIRFLLLVSGLL